MSFPSGTPVKTLTGTIPSAVAGTAYRGKVVLTPSAYLIDSGRNAVYAGGGKVDLDVDGHFSIDVLPCDAAGIQPTGWRWLVDVQPTGGKRIQFWVNLTGTGTIDLADVTPVPAPGGGSSGGGGGAVTSVNGKTGAVVLNAGDVGADADGAAASTTAAHAAASDPHGDRAAASSALSVHVAATDPHGDRAAAAAALSAHASATTSVHGVADTAALETQTGAQAKATAAQSAATSAAASDATSKVAAHSGASDPHGDRAWASSQFLVKTDPAAARAELGLGNSATRAVGTTAGTVAAGDDARFSSGGGTTIRTAKARITDGAVVDLPSAAAWAIVTNSVGTPLQCSIAASAGDRIRASLGMMYNGGHFMDVALLSSAGAIAVYDGSGTSSPLAEGAPWLYPSTAFSKAPDAILFTVGSGHLNAGLATVALVHQGTSTGRVYANATYPWLMLLENIGPQPS